MTRRLNVDRYDISCADDQVTAEVKVYLNRMKAQDINDMFVRIPEKSKVHFIVANKLQNSYFSITSNPHDNHDLYNLESIFEKNAKLSGTLCLVFDVNTSKFRDVSGLTDASLTLLGEGVASRLVVFLLLGDKRVMIQRERRVYKGCEFPPAGNCSTDALTFFNFLFVIDDCGDLSSATVENSTAAAVVAGPGIAKDEDIEEAEIVAARDVKRKVREVAVDEGAAEVSKRTKLLHCGICGRDHKTNKCRHYERKDSYKCTNCQEKGHLKNGSLCKLRNRY
jgi:hypothetical protein